MLDRAQMINEFAGDIEHGNRARGFWEDYDQEVDNETRESAFVAQKLMLVVSELAEAVEELRHGRAVTEVYESDGGKPEGFPTELADAVIRILDLAAHVGIPIGEVMMQKLAYNAGRGYKHGRAF